MSRQSTQRGSVRKEGNRWILRRRIDGREKRVTLGNCQLIRSALQARRRADTYLEQLAAGPGSLGERITLARFAPFFLGKLCVHMKPATRSTYASCFRKHLVPALGKRALADISERDATELAAGMHAAGRSARSVRLVVSVLAFALRKAIANGYAARPLDLKGLRLNRKIAADKAPRTLSREDIARIIDAAAMPWRSLYALLAFTGMRSGEALALSWDAIDFGALQIALTQAAYGGRLQAAKTEGSAGTLHMPEVLMGVLKDHLRWTALRQTAFQTQLLFPSPRDPKRPYWSSGVRRHHFSPLLKALGIPNAGLHAFRHAFATELFRQGAPASVVKALMRHSRMETTMRYTRVTLEEQRRAVDGFAAAFAVNQEAPQK